MGSVDCTMHRRLRRAFERYRAAGVGYLVDSHFRASGSKSLLSTAYGYISGPIAATSWFDGGAIVVPNRPSQERESEQMQH